MVLEKIRAYFSGKAKNKDAERIPLTKDELYAGLSETNWLKFSDKCEKTNIFRCS